MLLDIEGGRTPMVAQFYRITELLGTGTASEVYRAYNELEGFDVAIKIFLATDDRAHEAARREHDCLKRLQASNRDFFPKTWGVKKHRRNNRLHPLVVMELGQYVGDDLPVRRPVRLESVLYDSHSAGTDPLSLPSFWKDEHLAQWILDLCDVVRELHVQNIVHRDLKPLNILLKRDPGRERSLPFILDFEAAAAGYAADGQRGTRAYLPPEVLHGDRCEPAAADDLWAVCRVLWEVLFGRDVSPSREAKPWLDDLDRIASRLKPILLRGLHPKSDERQQSAVELFNECERVLTHYTAPPADAKVLSREQEAEARRNDARIRQLVLDALAGEGEIAVPKETQEMVQFLLTYVSDEETQAVDLTRDLTELGPRALPAILNQAVKLDVRTRNYEIVSRAALQLSEQDPGLSARTIAVYCASAGFAVRELCREMARKLRIVPIDMVDLLLDNEQLLLPEERVEIADLCVDFAEDRHAILTLTKYVCREYVLDPQQYGALRRIAEGFGRSSFPKKAQLIVEDTLQRIWTELPEYQNAAPADRGRIDKGLVQLLGDAFAATASEGLEYLTSTGFPRLGRTGRRGIPLRVRDRRFVGIDPEQQADVSHDEQVWRTFVFKLARVHPPTLEWLEELVRVDPQDRLATWVRNKLTPNELTSDQVDDHFERFVAHGGAAPRNALGFSRSPRVFERIRDFLASVEQRPEAFRQMLDLLVAFETRRRNDVLRVLLDFWEPFVQADFPKAMRILHQGPVFREFHEEIRQKLESLLVTKHEPEIRSELDWLLGH